MRHQRTISGATDPSTWNLPASRPSNRLRFSLRTLFVVVLTICLLLAGGRWALHKLVHNLQESHARSCLAEVSQLTDHTLSTAIAQGDYLKAIGAAQYIKLYYPPGTILPESHPFAGEYEAERQHQIGRIRDALAAHVGDDQESIWRAWRADVEQLVIHRE